MKRQLRCAQGFTLAEMLVTITIIVIIAGITIPLFVSTRATTRRNEASNTLQAAIAATREAAIERRTVVALEFVTSADPDRGDVMVMVDKSVGLPDAQRQIGAATALQEFIKFDNNRPLRAGGTSTSPEWTLENGWAGDSSDSADTVVLLPGTSPPYPDIAYGPDGTLADAAGTTDIALIDTAETARNVLRVLPATGLFTRAAHLQDPYQPESSTNPRNTGWF